MIQLLATPLYNVLEGIYDACRDSVTPVPGSVVYCDLACGYMEHSGIYVGNNRIAHLNGQGHIELVTPEEFIAGTSAINIYVSCHDSVAAGYHSVAQRAKLLIGHQREYNFIMDNCHQFTSGCLSGEYNNNDNFLFMLKQQASNKIGANSWRFWSDSDWR